jgi:hypothetical protein
MPEKLSRRSALAISATAAASSITTTAVGGGGAPLPPDPIFELIVRHRRAVTEASRLCEIENELREGDPGYTAANAAADAADVEADAAVYALIGATAATLTGALALARYAIEIVDDEEAPDDSFARQLLPTIERSLAALAGDQFPRGAARHANHVGDMIVARRDV